MHDDFFLLELLGSVLKTVELGKFERDNDLTIKI